MRKKGTKNKVYSLEFKLAVVKALRVEHLGLFETIEKFAIASNPDNARKTVRRWERIYLEEGAAGLMEERRGRKSGGRPPKLEPEVEEDLIAENQRLRLENDYLKKLHALVLEKKMKSDNKTKPES